MIESNILLAFANAVIIYGIYWACHFDWLDETKLPIDITRKNATPDMIEPGSKMIGWKIRFRAFKVFGEKWAHPIITCPICMSSVHSTYIYFTQRQFNVGSTSVQRSLPFIHIDPVFWASIFQYAIYILMVAGFAAIIVFNDRANK